MRALLVDAVGGLLFLLYRKTRQALCPPTPPARSGYGPPDQQRCPSCDSALPWCDDPWHDNPNLLVLVEEHIEVWEPKPS